MQEIIIRVPENFPKNLLQEKIQELESFFQKVPPTFLENRNASQDEEDLESLAGTWSEKEAEEFLKSISDFEKIDEDLWK